MNVLGWLADGSDVGWGWQKLRLPCAKAQNVERRSLSHNCQKDILGAKVWLGEERRGRMLGVALAILPQKSSRAKSSLSIYILLIQ